MGVVTKEQALEIALDHLTDGLRHRLQVSAGWLREPPRRQRALYQDQHVLQDIPKALRNPDADRRKPAGLPPAVPSMEPEEAPQPVWRVYVPGERLALGASRYIVVDQETGEVVADRRYGE